MDALHDPSDGEIPSIHKKSKLSSLPNFAAKHGKDRESEIDRVFICILFYVILEIIVISLFLPIFLLSCSSLPHI
jgi:hypothetical protein